MGPFRGVSCGCPMGRCVTEWVSFPMPYFLLVSYCPLEGPVCRLGDCFFFSSDGPFFLKSHLEFGFEVERLTCFSLRLFLELFSSLCGPRSDSPFFMGMEGSLALFGPPALRCPLFQFFPGVPICSCLVRGTDSLGSVLRFLHMPEQGGLFSFFFLEPFFLSSRNRLRPLLSE